MTDWKSLRKNLNLSQADVARQLGITQQAYANYERGVREADYNTLNKLAAIFNVSTDYLLGRDVVSTPADDSISPLHQSPKPWQRLINARLNSNKSEDQVSAAAGITVQTYRRYEKGQSFPHSPKTINAIADELGVTPDYLLGYTNDPTWSQAKAIEEWMELNEKNTFLSNVFFCLNSENQNQLLSYANFLLQEQSKKNP